MIDPYAPNDAFTEPTTVRDPNLVEDLCWAVSDSGDRLVSIERGAPHTVTNVGGLTANYIEAISFGPSPSGPLLYAADGGSGTLGTINLTTAVYTEIGEFGVGGGSDGERTLGDMDGLAFHPQTLELWGTWRNGAGDALVKIDFSTGAHIPNVWGPNIDYLTMDYDGLLGGASCLETDMDDLAISDDGRWYAQVDSGGVNQQLAELEVDANGVPTGRFLTCVDLNDTNGVRVEDMEGTGFDQVGVLWGTTGNDSNNGNDNRLWIIDPATGIASHPSNGGSPGAAFGVGGDYEGSDCRVLDGSGAGENNISGTVFFDDNTDGLFHPTEDGWGGASVSVYFDTDGDGDLDPNDPLVQTVTTTASGAYNVELLASGPYIVVLDTSSLPASSAMTTDTIEQSVFVGLGYRDPGNNFGFDSTTMALTAEFSVYDDGGVPVVEWITVSEVGTIGYYLMQYLELEQEWISLSDDLIPAVGEVQGGRYRQEVPEWPAVEGSYYALVEVEANGAERTHGPFFAMLESAGERSVLEASSEAVARVSSLRASDSARDEEAAVLRRADNSWRSEPSRELPGRPAVGPFLPTDGLLFELTVIEEGLVYVPFSDLLIRGARYNPALLFAAGELELRNQGEWVATTPSPDGQGFYFFAEASSSIFSDRNVYALRVGSGLEMPVDFASLVGSAAESSYQAKQRFEEQTFAATIVGSDPAVDFWFWSSLVAGHPVAGSKTFDISVDQLSSEAGLATLTVALVSASSTGVADEHHVEVHLNDVYLGDFSWRGRERRELPFQIPSSLLNEGDNEVRVTALLDGAAIQSFLYLDAIEISYPRLLISQQDQLRFRAESFGSQAIAGFSSSNILLFDVTEPRVPRVIKGGRTELKRSYQLLFDSDAGSEYFAVEAHQIRRARAVEVKGDTNLLSGGGADYVVITPKALLGAAERLAQTREQRGLRVAVVELEDIYSQFSYSNVDPRAIGDFLEAAYLSWRIPPRYVALVGAGTFDYRNYRRFGDSVLPPLLVPSGRNGLFAADLVLGDVVGEDGVPEIAVGRIPVQTQRELDDYIRKLTDFENGSFGSRVLLLADNPDQGVGNFPADSDALLSLVPPQNGYERIYLSERTINDARTTLFDNLSAGSLWVNYIGHGGVDRFGAEGLLTAADANSLDNQLTPIVTALTCVAGRFEIPGFPSLGSELVLNPNGGAVAVFAPSGLSINRQAATLDRALFNQIFVNQSETFGDAVLGALGSMSGLFSSPDAFETYNILGDPAILLP